MAIVLDGTSGITTPPIILNPTALETAVTGELEYDGTVPYFTPSGTQRGVIPGMQYYRLDSAVVGSNATGAQNVLGVGVTLSSNTVYAFEGLFNMSKAAGVTSHTVSFLCGGTATVNNIGYNILRSTSATSFTDIAGAAQPWLFSQVTTAIVTTGARTAAAYYDQTMLKGTISVNAGGTFIPQYSLSAAPGGAYTTAIGSYFLIYPIGASGSNINVGNWT